MQNLSQRYMEATPIITRIFTAHEAAQNDHFTHGIPKWKRVDECRISLTFREIAPVS